MANVPAAITEFLNSKRIAVAGVSRGGNQPANAIFRRLWETGHEVIPINPNAVEIDGQRCYPDLQSVPGTIDGVMVVTHPDVSAELVRQASERGVSRIWFHRSFGEGSASRAAVQECERQGIEPILGGCPLMFCGKVDIGHRWFRWWLTRRGRIPQSR
jgi:uncharacterized protein